MALTNTTIHYGSVTRGFHWLTALLVLTLIPVGIIANELPYETSQQLATKARLFSLHKTLGVSVFFVALLRILWALSQPKPAGLHPERKVESFLAETAHWLLYGSLVLAPLSGWIHHASTSGFAPIWWPFGQDLPLVPKSEATAALTAGLHGVFGKVMIFTLALHVLGALKHHILDRDATLRRMLGAPADLPEPAPQRHSLLPLAGAIIVWGAALASGSVLGIYEKHGPTVMAAKLEKVASDWRVEDGEILITITQFGAPVEGRFADWTAAISFDPTVTTGKSGEVETVISIGSLTLGSVTDQALGPDFFNVGTFETATFKGDLITGEDGFSADGALTIKGQSVPLKFPFALRIDGDSAHMESNLTLDRRSFGIGDTMADESSLKFAVDVKLRLQATRVASE